jgi:hypothetical protein
MNRVFPVFCVLPIILISGALGGCTSDPYAPINQATPIRQMDDAFDPSGSRYYDHSAPAPYRQGGYGSPPYSRY